VVYGQDFLPDIRHHVVSLDLSETADRPAVEPGMEVSVAYQPIQFIINDINRNRRMAFLGKYISDVIGAVRSLLKGMRLTGYYFTHHKEIITQQYPDNKETMKLPERFRGEVVMPHDEKNEHACTGCTACELACPNGTIKIITKFDVTPEGKKKKALDTFIYHLELCTMCNLCIEACPTDAIKMAQNFEHSVYDRSKLTKKLNNPGSKIREGVE
jgi:NADH-quinone oxidoreductase subunit I